MSYERRKVTKSYTTEVDVITLPNEIIDVLTKALRDNFDGGIPKSWRVNHITVSIVNDRGIVPQHDFYVEGAPT